MPSAEHRWRFVGSFGPAGGKIGIPANMFGSRVIIGGAVKEVGTKRLTTVEGRHNFRWFLEGTAGCVVVRGVRCKGTTWFGFCAA
jgi:hypothetical protein